MEKSHSVAIDYAKAFGITLVVMYHLKNSVFNIYHAYMFHMPLFFFIGGLLFKNKNLFPVIKSCLNNHLFYLIRTFIILGIIGVFFGIAFKIKNGLVFTDGVSGTVLQAFRGNLSNNHLFPVAWFLLAYMLCVILFSVTEKALSIGGMEKIKKIALPIIALLLGYLSVHYLSRHYHKSGFMPLLVLSQIAYGFMFYSFGYMLRKNINIFLNFYVFIIITSILYVLKTYGLATTTGMVWGKYPDGFAVSAFTGIAGIYATLFISLLLAKSEMNLPLLRHIGKSSKTIMSYHILLFVIVDIFMHYMINYKLEGNDTYLNHFSDKWTLPVYVFAGVAIPLAGLYLYNLVKTKITMKTRSAV